MESIVYNTFLKHFNQTPRVFFSPGRINIIGEHTDYNEGFVLPAAIDKGIYLAMELRSDSEIQLFSCAFNELYATNLSSLAPIENQHWANYILGVVAQFQKLQKIDVGFNLVFDGDIPIGAGLSSSAAVESAVAFGLNSLLHAEIEKIELVKIAQLSEQQFAGVNCGIMDMFASVMGRQNQVMKLDCRDLSFSYFPLHTAPYQLVLINTNIKHNLADSAYNERRQQCQAGVELVKKKYPAINSLRDVSLAMLTECVDDPLILKRCRYVIEEIIRVELTCEALNEHDLKTVGLLLSETHEGLKNDYEVSCLELDLLVDLAAKEPSILGARMMGGGFGGCTLNLVLTADLDTVVSSICTQYQSITHIKPDHYIVNIGYGSKECIF